MIKLTKIVSLILLSISTDALGNEVLHRLEFSQYDSETLRNIKPTQQLLDRFLEKTLQLFSKLEEPCKAEALNYNAEQIGISFSDLKITLENSSIIAKSELSHQILRIKLTVRNIFLDGTVMIKSVSTNQRKNFRFTSQNVVCSGIGGIIFNSFDVDCEWVILDCSQEHFTPLKIIFSNSFKDGKLNSGGMNFDIIESGLLSNIEVVLSSISSVKLKEALHLLDPTLKKLLHNVANMKFARLETSDSNAFLDVAISVASNFIKEQYNDTVHLPDIKEAIPCSLLSLLHCETGLIAEHGIARHVSTLQRIGNVRITRRNVTIDFAGTLKFQKLNIYYDKYRVSVLGIGPTGKLRVLSEPVIFGIQLRINFGNRRITLINFKLQKLGPGGIPLPNWSQSDCWSSSVGSLPLHHGFHGSQQYNVDDQQLEQYEAIHSPTDVCKWTTSIKHRSTRSEVAYQPKRTSSLYFIDIYFSSYVFFFHLFPPFLINYSVCIVTTINSTYYRA